MFKYFWIKYEEEQADDYTDCTWIVERFRSRYIDVFDIHQNQTHLNIFLDKSKNKFSLAKTISFVSLNLIYANGTDPHDLFREGHQVITTANRLAQKIYKDDGEAQKIIEVLTIWDALFGKTSQRGKL